MTADEFIDSIVPMTPTPEPPVPLPLTARTLATPPARPLRTWTDEQALDAHYDYLRSLAHDR